MTYPLDRYALDEAADKVIANADVMLTDQDGLVLAEVAIETYLTAISDKYVLVPRELDDGMVKAMRRHHEGEPYLPHSLYAALIAEIDAHMQKKNGGKDG